MFDDDQMAAGLLLDKLQDYREFAKFYGSDFNSYSKAFWNEPLFSAGATRIRIVGLNTVLISDKHDGLGQMILTQNQYMLPRETNVEYVVMMHHPIDWLKNSRAVREYMENRARICLMGHDHQLRVNHTTNLLGHERLEIYAGATNPSTTEHWHEFRYNWIEFSVLTTGESRELVVSLRPRVWTSATKFVADRNQTVGNDEKVFRIVLPPI